MAWIQRNDYCVDCARWGIVNDFWGCRYFKVYSYDDRDRLCGGRYKIPRRKKP